MDPIWLLRGGLEAPGWRDLERDSKEEVTDVLTFDRAAWALVRAAEPPRQYEGLDPEAPPDGVYLDANGRAVCLVDGRIVPGPEDVVEAMGDEARELMEKIDDAVTVLDRLGRVY